MQYPGLKQILDQVGQDPTDLLLRERFLVLIFEIPDAEKPSWLKAFAALLQPIDPKEALKFAYMVYQYTQDKMQLGFLANCLDDLGRVEVSAELRAYMQRPEPSESSKQIPKSPKVSGNGTPSKVSMQQKTPGAAVLKPQSPVEAPVKQPAPVLPPPVMSAPKAPEAPLSQQNEGELRLSQSAPNQDVSPQHMQMPEMEVKPKNAELEHYDNIDNPSLEVSDFRLASLERESASSVEPQEYKNMSFDEPVYEPEQDLQVALRGAKESDSLAQTEDEYVIPADEPLAVGLKDALGPEKMSVDPWTQHSIDTNVAALDQFEGADADLSRVRLDAYEEEQEESLETVIQVKPTGLDGREQSQHQMAEDVAETPAVEESKSFSDGITDPGVIRSQEKQKLEEFDPYHSPTTQERRSGAESQQPLSTTDERDDTAVEFHDVLEFQGAMQSLLVDWSEETLREAVECGENHELTVEWDEDFYQTLLHFLQHEEYEQNIDALVFALFDHHKSLRVAEILDESGLWGVDEGYFALYLDCLLMSGGARRALVVIQYQTTSESSEEWMQVCRQRLPMIWSQLGLRVPKQFAQLPREKLLSLIHERQPLTWKGVFTI